MTLLACFSADDHTLTPKIGSQSLMRDSPWRQGLRPNGDDMVCHRNPTYIDEELFYEYLADTLIPYLTNLRDSAHFFGHPGVPLRDSASRHISQRSETLR
jgi:hypothetical protein